MTSAMVALYRDCRTRVPIRHQKYPSVGQCRNIFQCRAFTRALPVKTPGKRTELTGRLQQRYGYAKDQAEREIDAWLKDAA